MNSRKAIYHRLLLAAALLTTSATMAVAQQNSARSPPLFRPARYVVADKMAYVIGDSELIDDSKINGDPLFSPDGEGLIVWNVQSDGTTIGPNGTPAGHIPITSNLICWNSLTHRPRIAWSERPGELADTYSGVWMPDSRYFCFGMSLYDISDESAEPSPYEIVVVDTLHAATRTIRLNSTHAWSLSPSPTKNVIAALTEAVNDGTLMTNLSIVDIRGTILQTIPVSPFDFKAHTYTKWVNSTTIDVIRQSWVVDAQGNPDFVRSDRIDLVTGKIVAHEGEEAIKKQPLATPEVPLLRVVNRTIPATGDDPAIDSTYLESTSPTEEPGRTLIAADAFGIKLVGDPESGHCGIVYLSHGSLLFAPIDSADPTSLRTDQKNQLDWETTGRLLRIRDALRLYARAHGSSPAGVSDLRAWLVGADKYLKDDSAFRDPVTGKIAFVYKFSSGNDPGLATDQTVPIGYMDTAAGRYTLTNQGVRFFDKTVESDAP